VKEEEKAGARERDIERPIEEGRGGREGWGGGERTREKKKAKEKARERLQEREGQREREQVSEQASKRARERERARELALAPACESKIERPEHGRAREKERKSVCVCAVPALGERFEIIERVAERESVCV